MPATLTKVRAAIRAFLKSSDEDRIRRRLVITSFIYKWIQVLQVSLLISGYCLLLALPSPRLGNGIFIDENALQPGQVTTHWNWENVFQADRYLDKLENLRDSNATSQQRAEFIRNEFEKMGIPSETQSYSYYTDEERLDGINAYSIISVPRASGAEAMVISATWVSRSDPEAGTMNLRGIATVLSLASFLRRQSHWAKDLIFVIGDGHLTGMHAWLSTYHGERQSNLVAESLSLTSGVIWTALNIDYPGHSFSHLGVFYEGLDGRLPNQDVYNSLSIIARNTEQVPVVLYDHLDPRSGGNWDDWFGGFRYLSNIVSISSELQEYAFRAKNVLRLASYQAFGEPSGAHGLYHKYRIDAITLFAVPATGPHGFYSIGKVIESTLRTMNNLLERLHASFFFYVQTSPSTFLKIGTYLPSAILISVSLLFGGLREWVTAGWWLQTEQPMHSSGKKQTQIGLHWTRRRRPVFRTLLLMLMTHMIGLFTFVAQGKDWTIVGALDLSSSTVLGRAWNLFILRALTQAIYAVIQSRSNNDDNSNIPLVLKSMTLCLASSLITAISLLNFSLAAMLCVLFGIPLSIASPKGSQISKEIKCCLYIIYALTTTSIFAANRADVMRNWELFGVWYAPFMYIIYFPLLLQASLVCM